MDLFWKLVASTLVVRDIGFVHAQYMLMTRTKLNQRPLLSIAFSIVDCEQVLWLRPSGSTVGLARGGVVACNNHSIHRYEADNLQTIRFKKKFGVVDFILCRRADLFSSEVVPLLLRQIPSVVSGNYRVRGKSLSRCDVFVLGVRC